MMCIYSLVMPIIVAVIMDDLPWCLLLNFVSVFSFWSLQYIASEIEMPFGDDYNDLPVSAMQKRLNDSLIALLDDTFSTSPDFEIVPETNECMTFPCPLYLITDQSKEYTAPKME